MWQMTELEKIIDMWLTHACEKGLSEQTKITTIRKIENVYNTVTKDCSNCGKIVEFNRTHGGEMIFICPNCQYEKSYNFYR